MKNLEDLGTPKLLFEMRTMKSNMQRMAGMCRAKGVGLRPHTKTHKNPEIAAWQMETGAMGVTVARVWEAEMMARAGIGDILIANVVMDRDQLLKLAGLARESRVSALVDSPESVQALDEAARTQGTRVPVLIEVDTGNHRLGVQGQDELGSLVGTILEAKNLEFDGLLNYPGHISHNSTKEELRSRSIDNARMFVEFAGFLSRRGIPVRTMSAGSTPTAEHEMEVKGITEVRPGTYLLNDLRRVVAGCASIADCAATIYATVISRRGSHAIINIGQRLLSNDTSEISPLNPGSAEGLRPVIGLIKNRPGALVEKVWDEHASLDFSLAGPVPLPGDKVEIIPAHICPSTEAFRQAVLVEDGRVLRSIDLAPGRVTEGY
ncbi:MAG: alanine racemase [Bacillota bacterium]|nr:alanine racemase [Bacillota bacterium]